MLREIAACVLVLIMSAAIGLLMGMATMNIQLKIPI